MLAALLAAAPEPVGTKGGAAAAGLVAAVFGGATVIANSMSTPQAVASGIKRVFDKEGNAAAGWLVGYKNFKVASYYFLREIDCPFFSTDVDFGMRQLIVPKKPGWNSPRSTFTYHLDAYDINRLVSHYTDDIVDSDNIGNFIPLPDEVISAEQEAQGVEPGWNDWGDQTQTEGPNHKTGFPLPARYLGGHGGIWW
ncbi:MAG: hypothetical protein DWQ31_12360 [Planctomycetota bacterium]|nr:MAG: hypothetical protein DWQ31_12360 [Planctomycetota bacterium]REK30600.1 MAG: hypothetical protein DWQ42_01610 [Planctomycetota bacterium]REK39982.1 MAG: hypothetical protein DWQ46_17250 [Planctomycetota bacterium]